MAIIIVSLAEEGDAMNTNRCNHQKIIEHRYWTITQGNSYRYKLPVND
jgi:hypothetical protein